MARVISLISSLFLFFLSMLCPDFGLYDSIFKKNLSEWRWSVLYSSLSHCCLMLTYYLTSLCDRSHFISTFIMSVLISLRKLNIPHQQPYCFHRKSLADNQINISCSSRYILNSDTNNIPSFCYDPDSFILFHVRARLS